MNIEVNHSVLFSLGFMFYWILPFIFGISKYYDAKRPMMGEWNALFDKIPFHALNNYMLSCLVLYFSFACGDFFGKRLFKKDELRARVIYCDKRILKFFFVAGIVAAAVFAFMLRDYLFHGYMKGFIPEGKGSYTASTVFLLTIAFLYSISFEEKSLSFWKTIMNKYFMAYFVAAILLLSLGGRTFFISSILMLLVYRNVYFEHMKLSNFFVFVFVIIVLSTLFAYIRTGMSLTFNIEYFKEYVFIFFSDSIYTSVSLIHFLSENTLPLLEIPKFLFYDLTNLLPSFIFPSKGELLLDPADYGYTIVAPVGAVNAFINLIINFGVIGSAAVFFLSAFSLNYLKEHNIRQSRGIYIMISGWLAISFFRDFSVTVVKLILEFSVIVPLAIILCSHIASVAKRSFPVKYK
jgi:oligosaccharide repeat unit polymerase